MTRILLFTALALAGCHQPPECVRGHWETRQIPASCECVCLSAALGYAVSTPAREERVYVCDERVALTPPPDGGR